MLSQGFLKKRIKTPIACEWEWGSGAQGEKFEAGLTWGHGDNLYLSAAYVF
jgi:hypothetical protein